VAQEKPATGKNAFQFLLVDVLLDKDSAANQTSFRIYQSLDVSDHDDLAFSDRKSSAASRWL
jgi:hypothetical protein